MTHFTLYGFITHHRITKSSLNCRKKEIEKGGKERKRVIKKEGMEERNRVSKNYFIIHNNLFISLEYKLHRNNCENHTKKLMQ